MRSFANSSATASSKRDQPRRPRRSRGSRPRPRAMASTMITAGTASSSRNDQPRARREAGGQQRRRQRRRPPWPCRGPRAAAARAAGTGDTIASGNSSGRSSRVANSGRGAERRAQDAVGPGLAALVRAGGRGRGHRRRPALPGLAQTSVRGRERQEGDVARALDGQGELALVLGAGAEHPPRQDLARARARSPRAASRPCSPRSRSCPRRTCRPCGGGRSSACPRPSSRRRAPPRPPPAPGLPRPPPAAARTAAAHPEAAHSSTSSAGAGAGRRVRRRAHAGGLPRPPAGPCGAPPCAAPRPRARS